MAFNQTLRRVSLVKIVSISLLIWLLLSLIFLAYILTVEFTWQFIYPYIFMVFGLWLWCFRNRIIAILQNWRIVAWRKFFLLAYGMVLFEEVFAALLNHLSEGFNFWVYLQRIAQFWAFNVLAFTGLIFATWFLFTKIQYSLKEMLFLIGLTGLYSERIIFLVQTEFLAFIIFAPIILFTYGFILSPALMSININMCQRRTLPIFLRYALMIFTWFLFSIPPFWLLGILRLNYSFLFPSCQFIPCN
jgi:hypothetical protein